MAVQLELVGNIAKEDSSLADILAAMTDRGTSVTLNWGEDNKLWEVCWITNGKRYVGFGSTPILGTLDCLRNWRIFLRSREPNAG